MVEFDEELVDGSGGVNLSRDRSSGQGEGLLRSKKRNLGRQAKLRGEQLLGLRKRKQGKILVKKIGARGGILKKKD